jgi:Holliday junction DNA helicase RuvA
LLFIGHISSKNLQKALFNKDSAALCKVPGVGKKTTERLLLELKDVALHSHSAVEIKETRAEGASLLLQDAISALINLGDN